MLLRSGKYNFMNPKLQAKQVLMLGCVLNLQSHLCRKEPEEEVTVVAFVDCEIARVTLYISTRQRPHQAQLSSCKPREQNVFIFLSGRQTIFSTLAKEAFHISKTPKSMNNKFLNCKHYCILWTIPSFIIFRWVQWKSFGWVMVPAF